MSTSQRHLWPLRAFGSTSERSLGALSEVWGLLSDVAGDAVHFESVGVRDMHNLPTTSPIPSCLSANERPNPKSNILTP